MIFKTKLSNILSYLICFFILLLISLNALGRSDTNSHLFYDGEAILKYHGYPSLIKFINGDKKKPLIIFVPGMSNLARIAYGYPGGRKNDFLSFWLHKKGYPFLAISYPLGNPIFSSTYPDYTIKEWSRAIINAAQQVIHKYHLTNHIIILGWSMAGEVVERVSQQAKKAHLQLELYISLSATPPAYNLIQDKEVYENLKPDQYGLANIVPIFHKTFSDMLVEQNKINHHIIIPDNIYLPDFLGNPPVDILGTDYRYNKYKFRHDLSDAIQDSGALNFNRYPTIAMIHGDLTKDPDALFNRTDWSSIILRRRYQEIQKCQNQSIFPSRQEIKLLHETVKKLTKFVHGSHFFFVGEKGAKDTANKIELLINNNNKLNISYKNLCPRED